MMDGDSTGSNDDERDKTNEISTDKASKGDGDDDDSTKNETLSTHSPALSSMTSGSLSKLQILQKLLDDPDPEVAKAIRELSVSNRDAANQDGS